MTPILGITASSITPFTLGDFESIATVVVGAGGAADIEFTSIPSTYQHLQVRWIGRSDQSGADRVAQKLVLNADTASNYSHHYLLGDGSAASSGAYTSSAFIYTGLSDLTGPNATAGIFGVGVMDILDYKDTNKYTTVRILSGQDQNSSSGRIFFNSGSWRNTAAVTSIKLFPESGSYVQYSHFALYGIRA